MKGKKLFIIIIIIFLRLVIDVYAQTEELPRPDNITSELPKPAICGDGICEDIEKGICPEDCEPVNNKFEKREEPVNAFILSVIVVTVLVTILIIFGIIKTRKQTQIEKFTQLNSSHRRKLQQ